MSLDRFTATLAASERLGADDMARYRGRALERLARHARAEVAFYRDRLAPLFDAADRFDPDGWHRVPVLTRSEAQAAADLLQAQTVPPEAGDTVEGQTSGSTGISFRHRRSTLGDLASRAMTQRLHRWHGLDTGRVLARITIDWGGRAKAPDGIRGGPWSPGGTGEGWHLGVEGSDAAIQADWLRRIRPAYLLTYPSAAREILATAAEDGGEAIQLDAVLTVGETVDDDTRHTIAARGGGRVIDAYGTQELGLIALQCPEATHYHVCAESQFVEILDDAGRPLPAGMPGRVVVTAFYNFAMPFIRYDTGDYAVAGETACACGRTLPVLRRILGRRRHVFEFAGRRIWPQAASAVMVGHVPNRQFQIAQTGPLEVEFRYVPRSEGQQEDRAALAAYLRAQFDPRIAVTFRTCETIPRRPGGKYEDYVNETAPVPAYSAGGL